MAKQKKKRFKPYRGTDASVTRPTVTRISAANRSVPAQWWFEKKRIMKPILITVGVIIGLALLLAEVLRLLSGSA